MVDINKVKQSKRKRRHKRVRAKIFGTAKIPRLSVYRSNTGIYLQLINDLAGKTLLSASNKEVKTKGNKTEQSFAVGKLLAEKAKQAKLNQVVFDKGGFNYHGRVRAAADGAREGGLKF